MSAKAEWAGMLVTRHESTRPAGCASLCKPARQACSVSLNEMKGLNLEQLHKHANMELNVLFGTTRILAESSPKDNRLKLTGTFVVIC